MCLLHYFPSMISSVNRYELVVFHIQLFFIQVDNIHTNEIKINFSDKEGKLGTEEVYPDRLVPDHFKTWQEGKKVKEVCFL